MIGLQRTAVEHIHEVVLVHIVLDIFFGCVELQRANTLGLVVVEGHLLHTFHYCQHGTAYGHFQ